MAITALPSTLLMRIDKSILVQVSRTSRWCFPVRLCVVERVSTFVPVIWPSANQDDNEPAINTVLSAFPDAVHTLLQNQGGK